MSEPAVIRNEGGNTRRIGARGLAIIEEMARDGHALATIAKRLRIGRTAFVDIRKRQPEVKEALERGYGAMEHELVSHLKTVALSGDRSPNVMAAMYLLNNRLGYGGTKVAPHLTVINNDNRTQTIQLPAPREMDDYRRSLTLEAEDA